MSEIFLLNMIKIC